MIEFLWGMVPAWAQWGLIGCTALFVIGTVWRIKEALALIKRILGWPAVAAVVGAITIAAAVVWGLLTGHPRGSTSSKPPSLRWPKGRTAKRSLPVPKSLSESN